MRKKNKLHLTIFLSILVAVTLGLSNDKNANAENITKPKIIKGKKFTPEEDNKLKNAIHKQNAIKNILGNNKEIETRYCWKEIAQEVGGERTAKQCRGRWYDYLSNGDVKKSWTIEQEVLLLEKQKELGNKWVTIAKMLGDKNAVQVKNKFKILQNKLKKFRENQPVVAPQLLAFNQPLNQPILQQQPQNNIEIEDLLVEFPENFDNNQFDNNWLLNGNFTDFSNFTNNKFPDLDDLSF